MVESIGSDLCVIGLMLSNGTKSIRLRFTTRYRVGGASDWKTTFGVVSTGTCTCCAPTVLKGAQIAVPITMNEIRILASNAKLGEIALAARVPSSTDRRGTEAVLGRRGDAAPRTDRFSEFHTVTQLSSSCQSIKWPGLPKTARISVPEPQLNRRRHGNPVETNPRACHWHSACAAALPRRPRGILRTVERLVTPECWKAHQDQHNEKLPHEQLN